MTKVNKNNLIALFSQVRACNTCADKLPFGPKPVIRGSKLSKLLIIGQAPGTKVHHSGIPWNDPSGDRLRQWLNMDEEHFYNEQNVAIMPMAFCYPGRGKSGDLPPAKECAPLWHHKLLQQMPDIKLTLLIGKYSQDYYLQDKLTLTERVRNWQHYDNNLMVLPHPSPRNNIWLKNNPWFDELLLPELRNRVDNLFTS